MLGLTKREYFAAMAMQGCPNVGMDKQEIKEIVRNAVLFSDELLKQLGDG